MISQDTLTPLLRSYRYDGLNRIREQKVALPHNNAFTPTKSWNTSYTYDLMGNITTLKRNAGQEQPMDRLGYNYYPNTNRLAYVSDSVPAADFTHDIDHQQPANYTYDAVGNMTKDAMSEITVGWNDYGKIKEVRYLTSSAQPSTTAPLKLGFSYDALASRLTKTYYKQSGNTSHAIYTDVYVRDPQGNPIATYTLRNDSLFLDELYIYGSQRVGLSKENRFLARKPLTPTPLAFIPSIKDPLLFSGGQPVQPQPLTLYTKRYELTDWLGNVRVVITNKKTPLQSAPLRYKPDVVSVTDYYAFGMEMLGRSYKSNQHDFGYNGKRMDNEVYGITGSWYDYGERPYMPLIGRFPSPDPFANKFPMLSSYQYASNRPIDGIDLDGLEYLTYHIYLYKDKAYINVVDHTNMSAADIKRAHGMSEDSFYKKYSKSFEEKGRGVSYKYYTFNETTGGFELKTEKIALSHEGFRNYFGRHGLFYGEGCVTKGGPLSRTVYDFSQTPIDEVDALAKTHDIDYDFPGYKEGSWDTDPRTLEADYKFVEGLKSYLSRATKEGYVDKYTGKAPSREAITSAVFAIGFFENYIIPNKEKNQKEEQKSGGSH